MIIIVNINHFCKGEIKMLAFVILFVTFVAAFALGALCVLFRNNIKLSGFCGALALSNFIITMVICMFH